MKIELYGNRELVHRGKLELHTGEIHIWKIQWRELETFWKRYNSLLEKEECQKTEHYRFYEDQMRYLAGKIAVRILLKEYSGVDKIVLGKGKYGKLYWKAPPGQKEITFKKQHNFNGEESTISMLNLLYDIYEHTFNAMMRYRPEGIYSGDITYINATEGIVNFYPDTNVATTWEDMVLGEFKIVNIYANHASIVGAEHSKEILPYIE